MWSYNSGFHQNITWKAGEIKEQKAIVRVA